MKGDPRGVEFHEPRVQINCSQGVISNVRKNLHGSLNRVRIQYQLCTTS
jgi:hypothetical protein